MLNQNFIKYWVFFFWGGGASEYQTCPFCKDCLVCFKHYATPTKHLIESRLFSNQTTCIISCNKKRQKCDL